MEKKKRKKRHYKINVKKKIIVLVVLGTFLFVGLGFSALGLQFDMEGTLEVGKYDKTLYGVLRKETKTGLAKKYDGEHQDSMDPTKSTSDIYHWYKENNNTQISIQNAMKIDNMNNVLFADTCWKMIRTTDTGGVKLLYNGNPNITEENGKIEYNCSNNRIQYTLSEVTTETNINGTYIFAKNYTRVQSNSTTTTFTLVDDQNDDNDYKTITINSSNISDQIDDIKENYPYTCKNSTGTCTNNNFFKVDSLISETKVNVYKSTGYDTVGVTPYNPIGATAADVGYMYGDRYNTRNMVKTKYPETQLILLTGKTLYSTSVYADSVVWNEEEQKYNLVNPQSISSSEAQTLPGKFTFLSPNLDAKSNRVYYVAAVASNGVLLCKELKNGELDVKFRIADDIINNNNGTYTLDEPTDPIDIKEWYSNYRNYVNKYTCFNSESTCSSPIYITTTGTYDCSYVTGEITIAKSISGLNLVDYITIPMGEFEKNYNTKYLEYKYTCGNEDTTCSSTNLQYIFKSLGRLYYYIQNHYFGKSVIYEDNKYKLQNIRNLDIVENADDLSYYHYTCVEPGVTECDKAAYITYYNEVSLNYIEFNNSNILNINNALDAMYKKNTTDSMIKEKVDQWYEYKFQNSIYEEKIDDTIYCNDRSFYDENDFFNENGGNLTNSSTHFNSRQTSTNLNCKNIEDKFSVSNDKAKLKYKIGLISNPEFRLHVKAYNNAYDYWTMTPESLYNGGTAEVFYISNDNNDFGTFTNDNSTYSHMGIRPVISLVKGTEYESGTGSTTDPYIVNMNK